MKNILHKQIISLIISVVILIVSIVTTSLFVLSMNKKVAKVNSVKEQIASYENNKKAFAQEAVEIKKISDHTKELESYIVTSSSTPELLSKIEDLAKANNVDFAITSVQTPGMNTPEEKLIIDFSAKGTSLATDNFLYAIKHQYYQVQVLSIILRKNESQDESGNTVQLWEVNAKMQIMSY